MVRQRFGSLIVVGCAFALVATACGDGPVVTSGTTAGAPTGAATTQPTAPIATATAAPTLPAGRLVFTRYSRDPEGPFVGIYVLDAGQSKATKVELPITVAGAGIPAWSEDGAQLVVNVFGPEIGLRPATLKPDGSEFHLLEPNGVEGDLECTSWSADGERLLCDIGSTNPKLDGVYELTLEGAELRRLTTSPFHHTEGSAGGCGGGEGRGVYSPDGTRFAFIRQKCGTGPDPAKDEEAALVVGDLASGDLTVAVDRGVRTHAGSQLSWSPDGQWIVFGTQSLDLALVHPDGSDYHVVDVNGPFGVLGPTWSPDGQAIVFATLDSGQLGDMYIVAPDGSGRIRVPGTSGGVFPSWTGG